VIGAGRNIADHVMLVGMPDYVHYDIQDVGINKNKFRTKIIHER
jgi:hypothetical protein